MPTAEADGTAIHYVRAGHGPALLFVHGAGSDHTVWGHQLQALKDSFTVAALDLNGHGRTPSREDGAPEDAIASYGADVRAVLAELEEPTVLLGHSLGGAVVQQLALGPLPENLLAIGLISTGAKLPVHPDLLAAIDRDVADAASLIADWAFHEDTPAPLREQARDQIIRNGQATLSRDFRACDAFDVGDQLGALTLPAAIVVGDADRMTPPAYAEALRERLPNPYLEEIEGAGHMAMLERPEALNAALRRFWATLNEED